MNKLIAYVGPFSFPQGGAAARRILGVSKTFQAIGYDVVIGSGQKGEGVIEFEGIDVHSLNERTAEQYPTLLKHLLYFAMGRKTVNWLDSLENKPSAVVLYSGYSPYLIRLIPWCKKHNIPLIFDAVEWYEASNKIKGLLSPYHWNIELAMHYLSIKTKNIIAISSYLENYYSSNGCNTVRIPPSLDTEVILPRESISCSPIKNLGYTGTPGHKDLLDNVLDVLLDIDINGDNFKLHIAGITEAQLLNFPALSSRNLDKIPLCCKCYGIVLQPVALQLIKDVDFSILLRPNRKFTNAGFPTKLVESLAVGTPVICNYTSDISRYITDNVNGLVCHDESYSSIKQAFSRLVDFDSDVLNAMSKNAATSAKEHFDINCYKDQLQEFMKNLSY
ncbi:glycosyltransferase [Shewanella sp. GutDb-MelDb]|uniref:glycosyltransferase n=1 Tax=Shewanella sp. GutDb-MelDb TaxID=2058316 RepID=UPI000C7D00E2|nr:glycosyltransferase [Shewanella sp. GutDb-MelDb]PKG57396.1 group 1 glycosyl transferase [Shewanella sp. GutDb-MelDb]